MFLNDNQIKLLCLHPNKDVKPLIENFNPKACNDATADLRVGRRFASPTSLNIKVTNSHGEMKFGGYDVDLNNRDLPADSKIQLMLLPGQVVLCHSEEYVNLTTGMMGIVAMRSTWARKWLNHSKADFIKPGYEGTITFELANNGPDVVYIEAGDYVMQIAFCEVYAGATPYAGRYNHQHNEVHPREEVTQSA